MSEKQATRNTRRPRAVHLYDKAAWSSCSTICRTRQPISGALDFTAMSRDIRTLGYESCYANVNPRER